MRFSAAHALRGYKGPCERFHGHNYEVEVAVEADGLDEAGLVIDFQELKKAVREAVLGALDHAFLNEVPPFDELNPTSENIARHIYERVAERLDGGRARVAWVRVWETPDAWAEYHAD